MNEKILERLIESSKKKLILLNFIKYNYDCPKIKESSGVKFTCNSCPITTCQQILFESQGSIKDKIKLRAETVTELLKKYNIDEEIFEEEL